MYNIRKVAYEKYAKNYISFFFNQHLQIPDSLLEFGSKEDLNSRRLKTIKCSQANRTARKSEFEVSALE